MVLREADGLKLLDLYNGIMADHFFLLTTTARHSFIPINKGPYPDFVAAVKNALCDFIRPDLLAGNPLLRSRLFATRDGVGPAELRALLSETVDALFAGARDEKLRRVIEFTYFRPEPKQEVTAQRLGLAFGTYRHHLATALDRLARWLWDRERGLRA